MSIQIITIDNRKKRILRELNEERKKKPRDSAKIYILHQQLIHLRKEDWMG